MELRPYQEKALDDIRKLFMMGHKKVLLHLMTGGGKTLIFSQVLKGVQNKGKRGLMIVYGRHLVDQASARLTREGVHHGIIMAGREERPEAPIQVCSISTLIKRKELPEADIIVIDEAHLANGSKYKELCERYEGKLFLPVTATPFVKNGLRHIADKVVSPITMTELISQGYLSPPRYFSHGTPDLSGVRVKSTGDYNESDLENAMRPLIGNAVETWLKKGENRQTILFAPTVKMSQELAAAFREQGIPSIHIDASSHEKERAHAIKEYTEKRVRILCNVNIFSTGVDLPETACIILYRPTKSLNLFIQQCGRGTRIADGKKDFIILDHSGNVLEHGFIEQDFHVNLDGHKKKSEKGAPPVKVCDDCYAVVPAALRQCECGFVFEKEERTNPKPQDGELVEIKYKVNSELGFSESSVIRSGQYFKYIAETRGYKPGWVYFQILSKYGEKAAKWHSRLTKAQSTASLSTKS